MVLRVIFSILPVVNNVLFSPTSTYMLLIKLCVTSILLLNSRRFKITRARLMNQTLPAEYDDRSLIEKNLSNRFTIVVLQHNAIASVSK